MTESRSPRARFVRRLPTGRSGARAASEHRLGSLVQFYDRYLPVRERRQADFLLSAQCPTQAVGQIPKNVLGEAWRPKVAGR